jgi:hypothetical protein
MFLLNFSLPLTALSNGTGMVMSILVQLGEPPGDSVLNTLIGQLSINIAASIIFSLLGVLLAFFIRRWYWDRCFSGWVVKVIQNDREKVNRIISPGKAKAIYDEPSDLSVFLKGVASPYGHIRGDILEEGPALGLLEVIEHENRSIGPLPWRVRRAYTINLDKNPREEKRPDCVLAGFPDQPDAADEAGEATSSCPLVNYLTARTKTDVQYNSPKPQSF